MVNQQINRTIRLEGLLLTTTLLFAFYFQFLDEHFYETCELCDRFQYEKLFAYFEFGRVEQIAFPFYTRPLVPWLASLIPGENIALAFHTVNFIFILASVAALHRLWNILGIPLMWKCVGFFWLLCHWTGIIRYNLTDYVTVDVPSYLFQTLALIYVIKKKCAHFYVLTPIALLQKESFIPVMIILIGVSVYQNRKKNWFLSSRHLIYALILGLSIQKLIIYLLPEQTDQRSSVMALLYHVKLFVEDPTRVIRWFAAIGSAFGVFPVLLIWRFRREFYMRTIPLTLILLSMVFMAFGLTAGEDMTRIIYLGFPFTVTILLMNFQSEKRTTGIWALLLSLPFARLYPFSINTKWAVDYANLDYVYFWAAYYLIAILIMSLILFNTDQRFNRSSH